MEQRNMEHRAGDPPVITLDRKIPLWGILTLVGALVAQGVLLWASSREQALKIEYLAMQVSQLTVELKSMSTQISSKSEKDLIQDGDIKDLQRQVDDLKRRVLK